MEKRPFHFFDYDSALLQIAAEGKAAVERVLIDLDENGIPTNCYFIVQDLPSAEPDLLAAADQRILELEYENLILQEGLA